MWYIVGLGNPGKEYEKTRHNVGFVVLRYFLEANQLPGLHTSAALSGDVSEGVVEGKEVTVLCPTTYMNNSGSAVAKLVPKSAVDRLVVVYDDIDLPLGTVKISIGKGDGGHNGVKSVVAKLGSKQFVRVRVGICPTSFWTRAPKRPKGAKLPKFVTSAFTKKELAEMEKVSVVVDECLKRILTNGFEDAMKWCNAR